MDEGVDLLHAEYFNRQHYSRSAQHGNIAEIRLSLSILVECCIMTVKHGKKSIEWKFLNGFRKSDSLSGFRASLTK